MDRAYHEYTSSSGGKILTLPSFSFFRNRFRFRNSGVTTSSFRCASQLSSSVSISSCNSSFCSGVRVATHFSLLKELDRGAGTVSFVPEPLVFVLRALGLGTPKKAVMLPPLGFLVSAAGLERLSAFRLTAGLTMAKSGGRGYRRGRRRVDSIQCYRSQS